MTKKLFVPKQQLVNRYTRAGYQGKQIVCPRCSQIATVYHFSWCALTCQSCQQSINKSEWIVHA